MSNPSSRRGLSFSISWGGEDDPSRASVSFGATLRIALAASLCVACYEAGQWKARLEAQAQRSSGVVIVDRTPTKPEKVASATASPGDPVGEKEDKVTALTARDPASLVFAPYEPPRTAPAATAPATPPSSGEVPEVNPPARRYPNAKAIKPAQRF